MAQLPGSRGIFLTGPAFFHSRPGIEYRGTGSG
jgi:hypothetical protein